jgi:hypothetical protein
MKMDESLEIEIGIGIEIKIKIKMSDDAQGESAWMKLYEVETCVWRKVMVFPQAILF